MRPGLKFRFCFFRCVTQGQVIHPASMCSPGKQDDSDDNDNDASLGCCADEMSKYMKSV